MNTDPTSGFADLEARYSERHRAYHNLAHVLDCLEQFQPAKHLARDPLAVEMALWYHDAVYEPRAKDNEERSAALAAQAGERMGLPAQFLTRVNRLILATKQHDASADPDAALMVDIDLSILGREPQRFDDYENQIQQEYGWVPKLMFAAGRTAVLEAFLARPAIFSTDFFRDKYERQARENLNRSIARLNRRGSKATS